MLGGLSLLSVVTAAITSGIASRAESRRRTTRQDPVIERLDQLASELQAVNAELERRTPRGTVSVDSNPENRKGPPRP